MLPCRRIQTDSVHDNHLRSGTEDGLFADQVDERPMSMGSKGLDQSLNA